MPADGEGRNLAILELKNRVVEHFTSEHWQDIGLITNSADLINRHSRLLRSLSWCDPDYGGHVANVLRSIIGDAPENLAKIQAYIDDRFGDESTYASSTPSERRITFAPSVFKVPDLPLRDDLVAVMMPFSRDFRLVHDAIRSACQQAHLDCLRADDIWDDTTFIQDVFNLIFQARIVVCDFSGRNPNVMYETGIAHTLGKAVVPIAQHIGDIPSDLQHHRCCLYLDNSQGLQGLTKELRSRLETLVAL